MAEDGSEKLDRSNEGLKSINKASETEARHLVELVLDGNDLQRLDGVDSYLRLERLSIAKNSLLRMHGVSKLVCLRELNLSNNSILTIEGLKELVYLKKLILSGNNIKSIEHLNNNINLEHLDLSDNQISHISDISYLKNLKHLHLEKNRIGNLKQCERYIPASLISFGLANNFLTDLNTLCHLSHLEYLENLSIDGNPCVTPNGNEKINFDYRPFAINWVMNVKILDGFEVNAIESLKAEWLYSQGRGRQFREGEHALLIQYLATTCPSGDAAPETEEQRKLRLILSKAQHHQQQLREQGPSPPRPRHSPRMHPRITGRVTKSPDRSMSSSFHSALSSKHNLLAQQPNSMSASFSGEIPLNSIQLKSNSIKGDGFSSIMSQSFDSLSASTMLNSETPNISESPIGVKKLDSNEKCDSNKQIVNGCDVKKQNAKDDNKALNQPLEAASKMVPVPDSMMSPDYQGPIFSPPNTIMAVSASRKNIPIAGYQMNSSPKSNSTTKTPTAQNTSAASLNQSISSNCESPVSAKNARTPSKIATSHSTKSGAHQIKTSKGSPQLPRSAMSSPKTRHTAEKRKGSFSSKPTQKIHDETHVHSEKNLVHNQNLINKINSSGKIPNSLDKNVNLTGQRTEIHIKPAPEGNSSDDDSEMCIEKLQSIRDAANQRRKKQSISDSGSSENVSNLNKLGGNKTKAQAYNAAVTIQKLWRGYRTRNLNQKTGSIMQSIQTMRARQYIEKLSCDMEATKAALDSERKIQQLQMQAINALWKKISAMECGGNTKECKANNMVISESNEKFEDTNVKDSAVRELTQTCCMLQAQVQQLQGSMREILQLVSTKHSGSGDQWAGGVATQTEITAVHTPQGDAGSWPYQKTVSRPSSLSLSVQNNNFNKNNGNGADRRDTILEDQNEEDNIPGMVDKSAKDKETCTKQEGSFENKNIQCSEVLNGSNDDKKLSEELTKDCLGKIDDHINQTETLK